MLSVLGVVDYVIIGFMLVISASVGLFFRFTGGRQKTTHEFFMAGKNMGIFPVAFSLMATYMSATALLGIPAEIYMYGTEFVMWVIGMPIGGLIVAYGFFPVFFDMETSTVYEYLEKRFGKTTRTVASLLFILQMIFYMAVIIYTPAVAFNAVTGMSTWTFVILMAVVCTFYSSLGGLKAVLWTDVFQAVLMCITIITVAVKGCMDMGGLGNVIDIASDGKRLVFFNTSVDLTERYTLWNCIIFGMIYTIVSFGTQQTQIQRMMSVGNSTKAQWALICSLPLMAFFKSLCCFDGVVIYSIFHDCDPMQDSVKLNSADQLMPHSILKLFGDIPGLPGLCIAGVFSAALSTASSAINSLAMVTMEDFIRPFCSCTCLTESRATFLAKIIAIGYGGLCLLLTIVVANFRGVLEATIVMFSTVGGPMLGVYSLGMFTTTANEPGTLMGLLAGFMTVAWMGFGAYSAKPNIPSLPRSTVGCAAVMNDTIVYSSPNLNKTILFDSGLKNLTDTLSLTDEEEKYVLPIYKVSYLWLPLVGSFVAFVVGYVASFIIGIRKSYPVLNPKNYSPFVRRWYFDSSTASSQDKFSPDMELK